jgi:hypothetical protein
MKSRFYLRIEESMKLKNLDSKEENIVKNLNELKKLIGS